MFLVPDPMDILHCMSLPKLMASKLLTLVPFLVPFLACPREPAPRPPHQGLVAGRSVGNGTVNFQTEKCHPEPSALDDPQ